jgi:hypothetical protein
MINVSVNCAALVTGSRNALTPLLTASTPVMAVHPLAKAFSISHVLIPATAAGMAGGVITK